MNDQELAVARAKIRNLLAFLKAFNGLRYPPVQILPASDARPIWWSELPKCTAVVAARPGDGVTADDDDGAEVALRVRRPPTLPAAPPPPRGLIDWVDLGWDDPERPATWKARRLDAAGEPLSLTVEETAQLESWKQRRDEWAARCLPDFRTLKLFERLWDVHTLFQREAERLELVLGDGQVAWAAPGGPIDHPVLLQPAELRFNAALPEFRVVHAERPPVFAEAIFRNSTQAADSGVRAVDGQTIGKFRAEVADSCIGPFDDAPANDLFQRLATALDPRGRFLSNGQLFERGEAHPARGPELQIYRDPVLFLRPRSSGFETAIDGALKSLDTRDLSELPASLLALVGHFPDKINSSDPDADDRYAIADEDDKVLLTKEANREQRQVVRRLQQHSNVLVQGPPGTGKTHTIANVLGHLLSEGKSVLVTAQTPKALRVLREKVVEPLQPLCVSVLEGDAGTNAQLRDSALKISSRISSSTPAELGRDAERLTRDRRALLATIRSRREELFSLVRAEYEQVAVADWHGTPSEAARYLLEHAGEQGWIPGSVEGEDLPLTPRELTQLYATNHELTAEDVNHIGRGLPDDTLLPKPTDLRALSATADRARPLVAVSATVWRPAPRTPADIRSFGAQAISSVGPLTGAADWFLDAVQAGAGPGPSQHGWTALQAALNKWSSAERARDAARSLHGPEIGVEWPASQQVQVLDAMLLHAKAGDGFGRLTLLRHGDWKDVLDRCSTIVGRPASREQLEALRTIPAATLARQEALQRWQLVLTPYGIEFPSDGVEAERWSALIGTALDAWRDTIVPIVELARTLGLDLAGVVSVALPPDRPAGWRAWAAEVHVKLLPVIEAEIARIELDVYETVRAAALTELASYHAPGDSGAPANRLAAAIEAGDIAAYELAHERLLWLRDHSETADVRERLLARLAERAPAWASQIRERKAPHGDAELPGDPLAAWTWKLLAAQLERITARESAPIVEAIATDRRTLAKVTAELVDRLAWRALMQNTSAEARAALNSYAVIVRKMGKGTGKRAAILRRAAQQQMAAARDAVPVWIAPLYRVAETFDASHARFDVVIIDEASQLDVTGLLAWFFGKQVIVVGDDEQVTPSAIGMRLDNVDALIRTYLGDIPSAELYDGQTSVYHLAQTVFSGAVQLREHFRCVPDIIGFSNALSYNWEILPLRNADHARVLPAVIDEFVEDGARGEERRENLREAERLASLLVAAHEQPEYAGLTFGVISLLGSGEQAVQVERLIHRELSPDAIENRRILCGTPPQFQGDERDVVFLAMVDGPSDAGLHSLRDVSNDMFKKRYNVAASRARDQLWVVHSVPREHLKPGDLRRRLIEHAIDPSAQRSYLARLNRKAGSPFEEDVGARLISRGYAVESQHPAGAYFIDLVVGDPAHGKTLAVECDGGYHFASEDQIRADLDRQALLERLGYTFHRIRGSHFYRDKDATIEQLVARLTALGIEPAATGESATSAEDSGGADLLARVRERAAEIRAKWNGTTPNTADLPAPNSPPPADSDQPPPPPPEDDPVPGPPSGPHRDAVAEPTASDEKPSTGPTTAPPAYPTTPDGRFPPYQEATLAGLRKARDLGDESDALLHPLILEVARVEGPVHFELLLDRLRRYYEVGRASEAKRIHVLRSIERLAKQGGVEMHRLDAGADLFVSVPGRAVVPRAPGLSGLRASRHIAPAELRAASLAVAGRTTVQREVLIGEAAERFGFNRVTAQLHAGLDQATSALIASRELSEGFGGVRLS